MPEEPDPPLRLPVVLRDRVADLPRLRLVWVLAPEEWPLLVLAPVAPDPLVMLPVEDPDWPPEDVAPLV